MSEYQPILRWHREEGPIVKCDECDFAVTTVAPTPAAKEHVRQTGHTVEFTRWIHVEKWGPK